MRFGSLFSGIGGLDLGLEWAGMECAWMCERDKHCRGWLRSNWPGVPLYDDITTLDPAKLAHVDLVCGGFPCQPVSLAGRRRGANDARWLWPVMRDIVSCVRPTWVLGENTPGIVTMGLDGVLFDLEALGYTCRTFVIPACAVDAPHKRDRVFVVAHSGGGGRDAGSASMSGKAGREALAGDGGERVVGYADRVRVAQQEGSLEDLRGRSEHTSENGSLAHSRHDHPIPKRAETENAQREIPSGRACGCGDVVNANSLSLQRRGEPGDIQGQTGATQRGETKRERFRNATKHSGEGSFWSDHEWITGQDGKARRVKPGLRLLAHGVPGRVDRLKALGNAVVPQVAYEIGRAVMAAHYGKDA